MSAMQVLLRDVRNGDILTITASVDGFVHDVAGNAPLTSTIYISAKGMHGSLCVEPDTLANVERPDPDAKLVEVMARAAYLDDDCPESRWPSAPMCETYRGNIRAALAAAREAGLL